MSSTTTPATETIDLDHYLSVMQSESDNESSEDVTKQHPIQKYDSANQVDIQPATNTNSHSKINESIRDLERFIDELLNRPCTRENSVATQQSVHLLYERIIYELKSEMKLLRDVNESTEGVLKDEIEYLRGELHGRNQLINQLVLFPRPQSSHDERGGVSMNQHETETKLIETAKLGETETSTKIVQISEHEVNNVNLESRESIHISVPPIAEPDTDEMVSLHENEPRHNNGLIADTIICNLYPRKSSKFKDVSIRNFPGSSTDQIYEYIKTSLKRKPTEILVHVGINDITVGTDTMGNIRKIMTLVDEDSPNTKLSFSSVILGNKFKTMVEQMNDLNSELEELCKTNNFGFIDNTNLDESCLDFKTLHLNSKGDSLLSRNILKHLRKSAAMSPPRSKKKHRVTISCLGI